MATGFGAALAFPFKSENKWKNLLFGMICMLIPIVGPIVLMGYGILIERRVIADPEAGPPDFDFGKFGDHLKRGLPPFVASLIAGLVVPLILLPIIFGCMFSAAFLGSKSDVLGVVMIILGVITYVVVILGMVTVMMPVVVRAGLEQSFTSGFQPGYLMDWLKRVGVMTLVYNLLLMLVGFLAPLGLCLLFVGLYLVIAYLMMVQSHVRAQLYLAYVARGGTPFAIATDAVPPGFAPVMKQP